MKIDESVKDKKDLKDQNTLEDIKISKITLRKTENKGRNQQIQLK